MPPFRPKKRASVVPVSARRGSSAPNTRACAARERGRGAPPGGGTKGSAWKPFQTTSGGASARNGSSRAAAPTQASTSARAAASSWPGSSEIRHSSVHQAGTLEAQSPPAILPRLKLIGRGPAAKCGSSARFAFQRSASSCSAAIRR